jgi:hypothetical protein
MENVTSRLEVLSEREKDGHFIKSAAISLER